MVLTVDFRDLRNPLSQSPLQNLGFITAHTRPVQAIAVDVISDSSATLFTADTMGAVKVWQIERLYGDSPSCRATQKDELNVHRTGVNDIVYGQGQLWTGMVHLPWTP